MSECDKCGKDLFDAEGSCADCDFGRMEEELAAKDKQSQAFRAAAEQLQSDLILAMRGEFVAAHVTPGMAKLQEALNLLDPRGKL